jgi:MscS family membrane protein
LLSAATVRLVHFLRHALVLALVSLSMQPSAFGKDTPPTRAEAEAESESEVEEPPASSPRGSVRRYFELARAGRYQEASAYLDLRRDQAPRGGELAARLRAVLDRRLWVDLEKLSDAEAGALGDGLPTTLDHVGDVKTPVDGGPVRLKRRADGKSWGFSTATVGRIDAWYEGVADRWLIEHLPGWLLRTGPRGVLWWQWLALFGAAAVSATLGMLASFLVRKWLRKATSLTALRWDDRLLMRTSGPLTLAFTIVLFRSGLPFLLLYAPAEQLARQVLRGLFLANLLWLVWRLVDVAAESAWDSTWTRHHPGSRALIPLARRVGKAVVAVAAAILFLSALGYQVTSLIAGLGIGGLALALASQKTVENLFGAFSLGIDQPFREGDFVKVEDVLGTVESLGLRSTKIRTLDRTVVSIPNGKLAEMRLETFAVRDRLRLACTLRLVYGTTAEQLRQVLGGAEAALRSHPKIWPDSITVRLKELNVSSLDVEVNAWFTTSDWDEFMLIRQDLLLDFMRIVAESGTSFSLPTQTVQLVTP